MQNVFLKRSIEVLIFFLIYFHKHHQFEEQKIQFNYSRHAKEKRKTKLLILKRCFYRFESVQLLCIVKYANVEVPRHNIKKRNSILRKKMVRFPAIINALRIFVSVIFQHILLTKHSN